MSETVTGPKCPNCGAPLELLPDHTCRWCHAAVAPTQTGFMRKAELYAQLSDSWGEGWKFAAVPGARHAIPWQMADELLTPAKEMMTLLHTGLTQPGMQHIASTQGKDTDDLAFSFNLLLNSLISAGLDESDDDAPATYLAVCNLLDALAYCRDTDPAWEQAAHDCAAQARQQFGAAWLARTEGDDPDPFQRELNDWVTTELKHAGKHHFWEH